jgi:hypothetical protein
MIEKINNLFRDFVNDGLNSRNIEENLKIKKLNGANWLVICSSMDCIDDTDLAISNFSKYGFNITKYQNMGENYLRLYGVLNSVYMQYNSLIQLIIANGGNNKKKILDKFKGLDICYLRNLIAAHPSTYMCDKENTIKPSQLQRYPLQDFKITINHDNIKEYDLSKCISEYIQYFTEIYLCLVSSLIKEDSSKKEFVERLKDIKLELDGGVIINNNIRFNKL